MEDLDQLLEGIEFEDYIETPVKVSKNKKYSEMSRQDLEALLSTFQVQKAQLVRRTTEIEDNIKSIKYHLSETDNLVVNLVSDNDSTETDVEVVQVTNNSTINKSFPWSEEVRSKLIRVFKLSDFRVNQLEAINETLQGHHCFILMVFIIN